MLVCNVSQSQRRAGITADLAEAAAAVDSPGTGNVVFATLVDDPASVGDHVDAYLGQIMREAASAAATVNAGLVYRVAVDETVTAISTQSGSVPTVWSAAVVEAATAASTQSATAGAGAVMRNATISGVSPVQVNSGVPPVKSSRLSSGTVLGA
jgi:hypothetical protein